MWFILFSALASSADLTLDSHLPTELWIDGHVVARLYQPGSLRVQVTQRPHEVMLFVNGNTIVETVDMTRLTHATIALGRSGISWPDALLAVPVQEEVPVDIEGRVTFRSVADEEIILTIDRTRTHISPGQEIILVIGAGTHTMNIRNAAGTVVWVRGELHVDGDNSIVQLADGRMPEVMGQGGQFVAAGG